METNEIQKLIDKYEPFIEKLAELDNHFAVWFLEEIIKDLKQLKEQSQLVVSEAEPVDWGKLKYLLTNPTKANDRIYKTIEQFSREADIEIDDKDYKILKKAIQYNLPEHYKMLDKIRDDVPDLNPEFKYEVVKPDEQAEERDDYDLKSQQEAVAQWDDEQAVSKIEKLPYHNCEIPAYNWQQITVEKLNEIILWINKQ